LANEGQAGIFGRRFLLRFLLAISGQQDRGSFEMGELAMGDGGLTLEGAGWYRQRFRADL